jgi:hypothetical protein
LEPLAIELELEMLNLLQQLTRASLSKMHMIAVNLNCLTKRILQACNTSLFINRNQSIYENLYAAVKANDLHLVLNLFQQHTLQMASLNLGQQTALFVAAPSVKMQAQLISVGVDFRDYMHVLYRDRPVLQNNMMFSSNQVRSMVLDFLLPSIYFNNPKINDVKLQKNLEGEFACPLTLHLPITPVRLGMHTYELNCLMLSWKTKKINPLTRLLCEVDDVIFDWQTYHAINAIYHSTNIGLHNQQLNKLIIDVLSNASLISYVSNKLLQNMLYDSNYLLMSKNFALLSAQFVNNFETFRQSVNVLEYCQPLPQICIALHLANCLRRKIKDTLFSDDLWSQVFNSAIIGIGYLWIINCSIKSVHKFNNSMYQLISIRETNNLGIEFLEPNMHKFEILFDPSLAGLNILDTLKLVCSSEDMIYLDILAYVTIIWHCFNFALNIANPRCFSDLETYDFKPVVPENILHPAAKPITFWKNLPTACEQTASKDVRHKLKT